MKIKWSFFCLLSLLFVSETHAARMEEQRKYKMPLDFSFSNQPFSIGSFQFQPHSVYETQDIYFDTDAKVIQKADLSFRLRRVKKGDNNFEYALQLKSESVDALSARMEEEYKDLLIQNWEGQSLVSVVNELLDSSNEPSMKIEYISRWMERKQNSSLSPFQELRRRNIKLNGIKPLYVGRSKRQRYHIYFDKDKTVSSMMLLKDSEKNLELTPDIFKKNNQWIWLMEASMDQSQFSKLSASDQTSFLLQEFEVENKYRPRERGTSLMNDLERLLLKEKNLTLGKESKFLQAAQYFQNNHSNKVRDTNK